MFQLFVGHYTRRFSRCGENFNSGESIASPGNLLSSRARWHGMGLVAGGIICELAAHQCSSRGRMLSRWSHRLRLWMIFQIRTSSRRTVRIIRRFRSWIRRSKTQGPRLTQRGQARPTRQRLRALPSATRKEIGFTVPRAGCNR